MLRHTLSIIFFLVVNVLFSQTTLNHNIGSVPIATDMLSCVFAQSWARTFNLSDFGIAETEKFSIDSGQVAIYNSGGGASVQFNIYHIDSNFPSSFSPTNLIGSSQIVQLSVIGETPEIVIVNFDEPILIPDGTGRILVEVRKFYDIANYDNSIAYIAGTEIDNDISWYWGCNEVYSHTNTEDLSTPALNANFFINVTGSVVNTDNLGPETLLTHNSCDDVFKTRQYACTGGGLKYGRTFNLEDFGISNNEEFVIDKGQVAFSSVGVWDVRIKFNVYSIDDNFPDSYSETDLIGSSQEISIPYFGSGNGNDPKIFDIVFGTPIVVPANVDRILVEVFNLPSSGYSGHVFIAGGVQSTDISWLRSEAGGCTPFQEYIAVTTPDVNYFINVSGNTNHITNNFEMSISNVCSEFLKEFSMAPANNVSSIVWNFGDPVSGVNNTNTDVSPFHDFSSDGRYTVTATVTANDGSVEVLTETITAIDPPTAYGIDNVYACEDSLNTGFSSMFNLTQVQQQVLGGQNNMTVIFIDGRANQYSTLPNMFTNTIKDRETITVRVAHNNNPCCYSETTFDLIVNPLPEIPMIADLFMCSNDANGFAIFNLEQLQNDILVTGDATSVLFYRENGNQIQGPLNAVENQIINEEEILVQVFENVNNCYSEQRFKLLVNSLPVAHDLGMVVGCDDNADGISEYFDTSIISEQVVGDQVGMLVTYYDENGDSLPSPLPNPYTNTIAKEEIIMVRVTNTQTYCYEETPLLLRTSTKPLLSKPSTIYSCDLGNGFANFDLSHLASDIIGVQGGLNLFYFDKNGNELTISALNSYENTVAWGETIIVRAQNSLNESCYAETSVDLIVNEKPNIILESSYFLCHLEPMLTIQIEDDFDYYSWSYENSDIISETYKVELKDEGNYTITIGKDINGILCENSFDFKFLRSSPPKITEVNYNGLSKNNFIEIIASGDGDFEYSLDGVNFNESNYFSNLIGGNYTAIVRDKNGCGEDLKEVMIIDYPKFFTPNQDGLNDYWNIYEVSQYPDSKIFIYDRYGKLIAQLSPDSLGWDGFFNGKEMISNDYWFKANLGEGTIFSGHFTLKR
ncbi:T9SS type B sorting domain-containing protein [Maribacter aquivivus]|uniref:T9SS type B sorting domain-containing protein n=1 Tax=Maribacter aquivivus TaxID=228958 RepID=UPI0024936379|nr:T9SS type B sorting domain-containing protein [Maribacter aquivivus]